MTKYNKIKIVCDAACRVPNANVFGRPIKGKSACGIVFLDENNQVIETNSFYLGDLTPPQAEYNGLIKALDNASKFCRKDVEIWLDSEFVIKQMNGEFCIKSENMKPLYDQVKILEKRFLGEIIYFHHPRTAKLAKQADKLANEELDRNIS